MENSRNIPEIVYMTKSAHYWFFERGRVYTIRYHIRNCNVFWRLQSEMVPVKYAELKAHKHFNHIERCHSCADCLIDDSYSQDRYAREHQESMEAEDKLQNEMSEEYLEMLKSKKL